MVVYGGFLPTENGSCGPPEFTLVRIHGKNNKRSKSNFLAEPHQKKSDIARTEETIVLCPFKM